VATPISPLTDAHYQELKNALDVAKQAMQQIDLAEQAGIDVSAQKQTLADTTAKLSKIKSVYFPGRA